MRGWPMLLAAVLLGAAGYYALDRHLAGGDSPTSGEGHAAQGPVLEPAEPAEPAGSRVDGAGETERAVAQEKSAVEGVPRRPRFFVAAPVDERTPPREPDAPRPAVSPVGASTPAQEAGRDEGLEKDRRLAQASLDAGDKERGLRILRGMYVYAKDRPGVDLSSDVRLLLEEETDREKRKEYLDYLSSRDRTDAIFQEQLGRCVRKLARVEDGREEALAAWDELTVAYELAGDRARKEKVIALLEPFIQQMVFSGAYTPLLVSYSIQHGDNLTAIARRHGTTVRAIKRINGLSSDHIQARQRLRILPGELEIFVDKSDFVLWATVDDRIFLELPVGIGRKSAITPVGTFKVDDRTENPTWYRPGQPPLPPGHPENVLGTRWIGFADTATHQGIGIHGTTDPADVGTRSSSGCIRLRQDDVELLFDFVDHGTEVVIQP